MTVTDRHTRMFNTRGLETLTDSASILDLQVMSSIKYSDREFGGLRGAGLTRLNISPQPKSDAPLPGPH